MIQIDEIEKLAKFKKFNLKPFKRIVDLYEVKKEDNVLIWCDVGRKRKTASPRLGKTFYEKFNKMGCNVSIIVGNEIKKMELCSNKLNDAVFSLGKNDLFISVGSGIVPYFHKNGKRVVTREVMTKKGFKVIATNGLSSLQPHKVNVFFESFLHDQKQMFDLNSRLKKEFEKTTKVKVTCPYGTDLEFKFGGRQVVSNDGNYKEYSTNYPVGEVYTAPLEASINGVAYIRSSKCLGETILNKKPGQYVFRNGVLIDTTLKKLKRALKKVEEFNKEMGVKDYETVGRTFAEFAIGTNEKAEFIGLMINDEKILGTCHFGIGSNVHFGGQLNCNGHSDHVIENPTVYFDDKLIVENGKILV